MLITWNIEVENLKEVLVIIIVIFFKSLVTVTNLEGDSTYRKDYGCKVHKRIRKIKTQD